MNHATPRGLQRSIFAALLVALISSLFAFVSVPTARADDTTGGSDDGGVGGVANGGEGGDLTVERACDKDGNLVGPDNIHFVGHPNCLLPRKTRWSKEIRNGQRRCPVGLQVFRFYGSAANPTQGFTTSMANADDWCSASIDEPLKLFGSLYTTSGYDTTPTGLTTSRALRGDLDQESGTRPIRYQELGRNVDPRFAGVWYSTGSTTYSNPAPSRPFAGDTGCVTAQNPTNPIEDFLDNPKYPDSAKATVEQGVYRSFIGFRDQLGLRAAMKEVGVRSIVPRNPAEPYTDRIDITWEPSACSSPMKYIGTTDPSDPSTYDPTADRLTGICYIPVDRAGTKFVNGNDVAWTYPDLALGYGMRYSDAYAGKPGTAANPVGARGQAPTDAELKILDAWRNKIASWYGAEVRNSNANSFRKNGYYQVIPADPYTTPAANAAQRTLSREKAMDAVRNLSKCRFGSRMRFVTDNERETGAVTTSLDLLVKNRHVLHAGGFTANAQTLEIEPQELACSSETADGCEEGAPVLRSLSYRAALGFPAGFKRCDASKVSIGCDYAITSATIGSKSYECEPGSADCVFNVEQTSSVSEPLKIQLAFFTPTKKDDRVSLTLSNMRAVYSRLAAQTTLDLDLVNPVTGEATSTTTQPDTTAREDVAVERIEAVGSPLALERVGGSYTWTAPVVSSINSGS